MTLIHCTILLHTTCYQNFTDALSCIIYYLKISSFLNKISIICFSPYGHHQELRLLWCGNCWSNEDISFYITSVSIPDDGYTGRNTQFKQTKTNSVALSPQANYTDWTNATCQRNLVPTLVERGVLHGQCGGSLTVIDLSFLDWSHFFSFK
jgi:hypothetical protein